MLPATVCQADEVNMSTSCVIPPVHISLDQVPNIGEETSPKSTTKSPTSEPLDSDPSPKSNEVTTFNVLLELQRKRPHSPENCDDDNNKRCCVRLDFRRDSESGFSSATEDTNDTLIIDKHSTSEVIDVSSSPESAISYLFSPPSVPSVSSPYNYPRNYSFCGRIKHPNHKPLDLTTETAENTHSKITSKKICVNPINKNIYNEPEQYNSKTKKQDIEKTIVNKEMNVSFNNEEVQNLSLDLQRQVNVSPDILNVDTDESIPINLQHKPSCDTNMENLPSNLQIHEESETHSIIDGYESAPLTPQNCMKKSHQIIPTNLSETTENGDINLASINEVPTIIQDEVIVQNINVVSEGTEIENQKDDNTNISNVNMLCQLDEVHQPVILNVDSESQVQQVDNVGEADLAAQCLQEFFKSWNDNCSSLVIIPDYTDIPLDPVYTNNDVDVHMPIQVITSESLHEQSMTCIIDNVQTVSKLNDIPQQEVSNNEIGTLPEPINHLTGKNDSINEIAEISLNKKEESFITSKEKYNIPLSMPLLGGEPELPPISEQEDEEGKKEKEEKELPQSQESVPSLSLEDTETQNSETTLSQKSLEIKAQSTPHTSDQSEASSPESDMLQKIMKPTLPQSSTLTYSRLFKSDHFNLESYISRPSVSPKSSIPVILSPKVVRSRTPAPSTPTRILPKRRASLGSTRSNSPDLLHTPTTRSMRKAAAANITNQQDFLPSSPSVTESSVDEDFTLGVGSPTCSIPSTCTPTLVPTRRGRGRPKRNTLSNTAESNDPQDFYGSPITRSRKKSSCTSASNSLSPLLLSVGSETPKRGQGRGRSNSFSNQSPSIKGAKGRGRSHSPAVKSKVKRAEEIKLAIEANAPKLSASDLFVQREREKMLQYDSWMETRRELYSKLVPNIQIPSTTCTNMQPQVVLERNPGLDARAVSDAALVKLQIRGDGISK